MFTFVKFRPLWWMPNGKIWKYSHSRLPENAFVNTRVAKKILFKTCQQ